MFEQDIFFVIGPTASGKTALSIELATMCDGEIINTDASAFYKVLLIE